MLIVERERTLPISSFPLMPSRLRSLVPAALLLAAACASLPLGRPTREYWAFTAPWDPRSDSSVRQHASVFDAVVYGWMSLDTVTALPVPLYDDTLSRHAPSSTRRLLLVTDGIGGSFHPDVVRRLATDDALLARAAGQMASHAQAASYQGVILDLEGLSAADRPATAKVVRAFADAAHAHGLSPVAVAVPALDTAGYPAAILRPAADYLVVMLYDEHWSTSPPGPIASPDWVRMALGRRVAESGASHLVAALPIYGYQWPASGPGLPIGYEQARRLAATAGVELTREPQDATLHAVQPGQWTIWVSDAELVRALLGVTDGLGVTHVAFWRLGLEDPALWQAIAR